MLYCGFLGYVLVVMSMVLLVGVSMGVLMWVLKLVL